MCVCDQRSDVFPVPKRVYFRENREFAVKSVPKVAENGDFRHGLSRQSQFFFGAFYKKKEKKNIKKEKKKFWSYSRTHTHGISLSRIGDSLTQSSKRQTRFRCVSAQTGYRSSRPRRLFVCGYFGDSLSHAFTRGIIHRIASCALTQTSLSEVKCVNFGSQCVCAFVFECIAR